MGRLERVRTRVENVLLGELGRFDESGDWSADAAYGTANWLSAQTGTSKADANARVKLAKRLRSMPITASALSQGEITLAHATALARGVANPRTQAQFAWDESKLVGLARKLTADQLVHEVEGWIELHDQDGRHRPPPELAA